MPAPSYLGSASGGTALRTRATSYSLAVTVPTNTNFALALVFCDYESSGAGYPAISLNSVAMTNYYTYNRGYGKRYVVAYTMNPATGSRTFLINAGSVAAQLFCVSFFSGADTSSPIVSYVTGTYTDVYSAPQTSITSGADYFLWSSADQGRWQTIDYSQPYATGNLTTYIQGQSGGRWNGDSDEPEETLARGSIAGGAGGSGTKYVIWNNPYLGSNHVFLCNIRGVTAKGFSQAVTIF